MEHPYVRVFHQETRSAGQTRNVGVRHSRAEYVQFVDQDDKLSPRALENLYHLAPLARRRWRWAPQVA